jgi:hypothetical protein
MAGAPSNWLGWQVRRVRRRLFLQNLVNATIIAWLVGCAIFAAWWLARPYLFEGAPRPWADWAAGSTIFVVASLAAIIIAWRRSPSPISAALSLDERFQLRERVTTSLTLAPELQSTPAGQALIADAEEKVAKLDVRSRFPVRLGWKSMSVPAAVAALFLISIFYEPAIKSAHGNDIATSTPLSPQVAKELEMKRQEFSQTPKKENSPEKRIKSEDVERIEAQLQEILKKPMTTTDEVKDRIAEVTKLEEEAKKNAKEQSDRIENFKEQMRKLDRLSKKDKSEEDKEQSKDLREALKEGDTEKAKNEADRLSKKIKDSATGKQDLDRLSQEMKDLKDDLEKLKEETEKSLKEKHEQNEANRQEREKKLEQEKKEGKIDKEEAERQKKEIEQERQKEKRQEQEQKKQLDHLAKKMGECEKCLKKGDREGAAQAMKDASQQLDEMQDKEEQLGECDSELQRLRDVRESMCKATRQSQEDDAEELTRRRDDEGDGDGKGGKNGKNGKNAGNRPYSKPGGVGKGQRLDGKQVDTKSRDARQTAAFDKNGAKIQIGTMGQADKVIGKKGVSLEGEIKQASQDAPDAVETQRIPRGYKDSTKGYFKNIGNQKTGEKDPPK